MDKNLWNWIRQMYPDLTENECQHKVEELVKQDTLESDFEEKEYRPETTNEFKVSEPYWHKMVKNRNLTASFKKSFGGGDLASMRKTLTDAKRVIDQINWVIEKSERYIPQKVYEDAFKLEFAREDGVSGQINGGCYWQATKDSLKWKFTREDVQKISDHHQAEDGHFATYTDSSGAKHLIESEDGIKWKFVPDDLPF